MKKLFFIITTILLFNSINHEAFSQPCDYNPCDSTEAYWTKDTLEVPNTCEDCDITVHYWFRTNTCETPGYVEVQLEKIFVSLDCFECYNYVDLILIAFEYVVKYNPLSVAKTQNNNDCVNSLLGQLAHCWQPGGPTGQTIQGCDVDCCWFEMNVCNVNGVITVEYVDHGTPILFCEENPDTVDQCFYVCQKLYDYLNPPEILNPTGMNDLNDIINNSHSFVKPNPNDGFFDIHVSSPINNNISIEISDITGNIVYQKDKMKKQNDHVFNVDLSNKSNGNYYYTVKYNHFIISKGKIVLMR